MPFSFQEILIKIISIADLRAFVKRLLKVQGTTFNALPIARKLGMTDQQCNQVLLCWKSEDEQMEEIAIHAANIRNCFYDDRKRMEEIIPPVLLVKASYHEKEVSPRKKIPVKESKRTSKEKE